MIPLDVRSLTKYYGSAVGVEDVTFGIEPGEILGYLGPNGSGKTTTLRCIMGLLKPDRGQIRIFGTPVVTGQATEHDRIGYLPGDFRIWRSLTARRALSLLAGMGTSVRAKLEMLAERLDLDLDRRIGELSKGNRQKVAIIYVLQNQPDLLILDEPTSGLDPLVRQTVMDLIREAAKEGAAVLFSSHDLNEVSSVCGRAGILRQGRLVELAPISKIVQQSEHRLQIWFREESLQPCVPAEPLGLRVIEQEPGMLHLAFQGPADPILKWVAQFPVDRIATPQTSLEKSFLQYYSSGLPAETNGTMDAGERSHSV